MSFIIHQSKYFSFFRQNSILEQDWTYFNGVWFLQKKENNANHLFSTLTPLVRIKVLHVSLFFIEILTQLKLICKIFIVSAVYHISGKLPIGYPSLISRLIFVHLNFKVDNQFTYPYSNTKTHCRGGGRHVHMVKFD